MSHTSFFSLLCKEIEALFDSKIAEKAEITALLYKLTNTSSSVSIRDFSQFIEHSPDLLARINLEYNRYPQQRTIQSNR